MVGWRYLCVQLANCQCRGDWRKIRVRGHKCLGCRPRPSVARDLSVRSSSGSINAMRLLQLKGALEETALEKATSHVGVLPMSTLVVGGSY